MRCTYDFFTLWGRPVLIATGPRKKWNRHRSPYSCFSRSSSSLDPPFPFRRLLLYAFFQVCQMAPKKITTKKDPTGFTWVLRPKKYFKKWKVRDLAGLSFFFKLFFSNRKSGNTASFLLPCFLPLLPRDPLDLLLFPSPSPSPSPLFLFLFCSLASNLSTDVGERSEAPFLQPAHPIPHALPPMDTSFGSQSKTLWVCQSF